MAYNLRVTEHADELLDNILHYLIYQFKSEQAAKHLLDEIEHIHGRLYVILFRVQSDVVNIVGIFHQLENYRQKL